MIEGKIVYGGKHYSVRGRDISDSMSLVISGQGNYNNILFMTGEGADEDKALWERGFKIGLTKVTVETAIDEIGGKSVKQPVNKEFFARIGAIIQYMKSHCYERYSDGIFGVQVASGEFTPEAVHTYNIPMGDTKGHIELRFGSVIKLNVTISDIEIALEESFESEELLPSFTNGVQIGFKMDEDYLLFVPESNNVTDFGEVDDMLYKDLEEVIAAHPEKDFTWLREKDYHIVTDDTLEEVCNYLYDSSKTVYYDTETTGLNINFYSRLGQADVCVGIILSIKYGESFFFPMQMKRVKNLCGGDHTYFMEHYAKRILEQRPIVCHNAPFDWKVSYIYDINANIVGDTMSIMHITIQNQYAHLSASLKRMTEEYLRRTPLELSDLVKNQEWGESDVKFWDLPEELVRLYACADTDDTMGLDKYFEQLNILTKYNAHKIYEIELSFGLAVAYQEFYGHRIDIDRLDYLRSETQKELDDAMAEMEAICGHEFNANSPKQLVNIIYTELQYPEQISRKTNRVTTDANALKHLASLEDLDGNKKCPFVVSLLRYRKAEGVRKIIDKFPETMTQEGYIFSEVQQYGTRTGRVSIKKPNYQSYNDPIKKNVVPREGYYMFDTDYSSVEYRVLGNMAGNEGIKESFKDPEFDYHTYQAAHLYSIPYASVTKTMRKASKSLNFGIPYGMGDESMGVNIFGEASPENTAKAAQLKKRYFKGQEDIQEFFEAARNKGVTEGFTETFFGRRRYYNKQQYSVGSIRRQAGNQVIQGCFRGKINTKEYGIIDVNKVVGEHLHVWDGMTWTECDIVASGLKRKCLIHFTNGQIFICSPDHRFLVRDNHKRERFVRCEDLKFGYASTANNSHIRVNTNYEPSDFVYSSEEYYKYEGVTYNANNVFIDSLDCDRFEIGVVLGRLASDGNYSYSGEHTNIKQVIAEHEDCIIPLLEKYMKGWNAHTYRHVVRNDRNEALTHIGMRSVSLTRELNELDIRHSVNDNIFMDTEILRGFMCGFFDGDGGIAGKTITLVQGTQYDFEPMFKDIQKALLFFGVRSRYRFYEGDRYVLQIQTHDNQKFLDIIGFLNEKKQSKGRTLKSKELETTFGKCLVVDYVEITDEYIDMYDVCNTERGYFVADGLITHNSAADIYKLAVGRVFRRICKEGWLGKVLLSGFIHDELLGEVSNDIDPMIFLKVLREEFEVKINNSDGSPWCPLYMGFGFGRNWYEAKSVELPIRLQWEFVRKYGDSGYPDWHGNADEFCDSLPDIIHDFEIRDCAEQLYAEENQGKEIKPALNSMILELVGGADDTQAAIDKFCEQFGYERDKINVLNIVEQEASSIDDTEINITDEEVVDNLEILIDNRIRTLGMYVDTENKSVKMLIVPPQYMYFIKERTVPKGSGGYTVWFRDDTNDYITEVELPAKEISTIQQMYIQYMKAR